MNKKFETLKELFGYLNLHGIYYAVTGMGWFAKDSSYGIATVPDKLTLLVTPSEFFQAIALLENRKIDDPFVHLIRADVDSWITVTRSKTINFDGIEVKVIREVNRQGLFFLHEEVPGFFTTVDNPADGGKYLNPLDQLIWMSGEQSVIDGAVVLTPYMPTLLKQIGQNAYQVSALNWIRQTPMPQFWHVQQIMNAYDIHRENF